MLYKCLGIPTTVQTNIKIKTNQFMALDFSRLNAAKTAVQSKEGRKDFSKIYYKPGLGKQKVRIVPWKEDPSFPFIQVQLHKYDTFKKFIPTLANWEEEDPILKFRKKVFDDITSTKEDKDFMRNLSPRTATFVQVIVRGQEAEGVRLWELNKTNYESVLAIITEVDEYGEITDIVEGRDLIVEGHNEVNEQTKKTYIAVDIKVSVNKTPLSKDPALIELWLSEQQSPLDQYKKLSAEDLSKLLKNFLSPADGSDEDEELAPAPKPAPKAPAKAPTAKKFVKLEEVEPEVDPELAEEDPELAEEVAPPAPAPKAKAPATKPAPKPVAKPTPVEDPEDLPWEGGDDELAEAIPPVPAPKAKVAAKAPAKAPAAKPSSISAKFAAAFEEDED